MSTLKLLLLTALFATSIFSCQENEEAIQVIEDQESAVSQCFANGCGARVRVFSNREIRRIILNNALNQIRRTPSFDDLYNMNRSTWIIRHQGGNRYDVLIPNFGEQIQV
ncbi:MAG: hypothetical protein AAF551_01970 [Bacteroidota bacterium]